MIRSFVLLLMLGVAVPSLAADLGVDAAAEARFRAEARAIAARPAPDERKVVLPGEEEQALIDTDPDLNAAWRSDPEATLDLIRRIIEAAEQ